MLAFPARSLDRSQNTPLEGFLATSLACTKLQSDGKNFRHDFSQCEYNLRKHEEELIKEIVKDKL